MNTNEKLKEILMRLITERIESQVKPALGDLSMTYKDQVVPGYDSRLEKIATTLIEKAEAGDIKTIAFIREIVGNIEWPK